MVTNQLNDFVESLNQTIPRNYEVINNIFNNQYGYPEFDPLRDEICKCIMCGLYQAAITLTNHLLETSLKKCLAMKYSIEHKEEITDLLCHLSKSLAEYDSKKLFETINEAYSCGLISEDQKSKLHEFRMNIRNAYSHAESKKIFAGISAPAKAVSSSEYEKTEDLISDCFNGEYKDTEAKHLVPFHGIIQAILSEDIAIPYFMEVDQIIRSMITKLKGD